MDSTDVAILAAKVLGIGVGLLCGWVLWGWDVRILRRRVEWLQSRNERLRSCLIGEIASAERLMVKLRAEHEEPRS